MSKFYSRTENSNDRWETPQYFFDMLDAELHFTLDAAASDLNHKCEKYYTEDDDGLLQDWAGETVFVNPPFSEMSTWVKKCYAEGEKGHTVVALITPSRTDTAYWHEYIMKSKQIRFCKGRVHFLMNGIKPKGGATFPTSIVVFWRLDNPFMIHTFPKISTYHHR